MKLRYRGPGGETHDVVLESKDPWHAFVECASVQGHFRVAPLGTGRFRMSNGERSWLVCVDGDGSRRQVTIEGVGEGSFERASAGRRRARELPEGALSSPMPGTVVKVLVAEGDRVERGEDLLVVEAMKMEIKISTPVAGTLKKLLAGEGDPCDAGQILAEVDPETGE